MPLIMNTKLALSWLLSFGAVPVPSEWYSQVKNYDIDEPMQLNVSHKESKIKRSPVTPTESEKNALIEAIQKYIEEGDSSDEAIYSRLMIDGKLPTRGVNQMEFVSVQAYTKRARKATGKTRNDFLLEKYLKVVDMYTEQKKSREEIRKELDLSIDQVNHALKKCGIRYATIERG